MTSADRGISRRANFAVNAENTNDSYKRSIDIAGPGVPCSGRGLAKPVQPMQAELMAGPELTPDAPPELLPLGFSAACWLDLRACPRRTKTRLDGCPCDAAEQSPQVRGRRRELRIVHQLVGATPAEAGRDDQGANPHHDCLEQPMRAWGRYPAVHYRVFLLRLSPR